MCNFAKDLYFMKNENKIVELLTDLLIKQDEIVGAINGVQSNVKKLNQEQTKTNLALGELRLSVMRLADEMGMAQEHEKRIDKLEHKVFGKG